MRLIGSWWRCFDYTLVAAGPCAVAVDRSAVGAASVFFDCLVVRVVVESGDHPLIGEAVHAIRQLCAESDAAYVVLTGVPHFAAPGSRFASASAQPDVLTHVADTLDVLTNFAERLEEYGERVHLMPFGWKVVSHAEISSRRRDLPSITISDSGEVRPALEPRFRGANARGATCSEFPFDRGYTPIAKNSACAFDLASH